MCIKKESKYMLKLHFAAWCTGQEAIAWLFRLVSPKEWNENIYWPYFLFRMETDIYVFGLSNCIFLHKTITSSIRFKSHKTEC